MITIEKTNESVVVKDTNGVIINYQTSLNPIIAGRVTEAIFSMSRLKITTIRMKNKI